MSNTHIHKGKCGNCGGKGHLNRNCPYPRGVCHYCKCVGHTKHNCPIKGYCEYLFNVFPSLKEKNGTGVSAIYSFCSNTQDWDWSGRYWNNTRSNCWPSHITGSIADNMERKMCQFNTNDSLDVVVQNTVNAYNKIINIKNGNYINWFNLMSRILYIKRKLDH